MFTFTIVVVVVANVTKEFGVVMDDVVADVIIVVVIPVKDASRVSGFFGSVIVYLSISGVCSDETGRSNSAAVGRVVCSRRRRRGEWRNARCNDAGVEQRRR